LERGTRTLDGSPGPSYWQNWATYDIEAQLDPVQSSLEGSVTIRYENRSPVALRFVSLNLYQNLHLAGGMRNSPQEVTSGVELRRVAVAGEELREGDFRRGPSYTVSGTVMNLRPPGDLESGDTLTLEIDWAVTLPKNGAGRLGSS
jgi:hypothetical protein